ncbi:MAG: hypothetical protein HN348_35790, partial [Proteobacteria bacterium]|nr:hypothetical protein [Pseudomonadota bacterium]
MLDKIYAVIGAVLISMSAYSAGYGVSHQDSSAETGVLQKDLAQCY